MRYKKQEKFPRLKAEAFKMPKRYYLKTLLVKNIKDFIVYCRVRLTKIIAKKS